MQEHLCRYFMCLLTPLFLGAQSPEALLKIESEIDGLSVHINEVYRGILSQNKAQYFSIDDEVGTGGFGFHSVIVQKEINATHEYYAQKEFKYKPFEPLIFNHKNLQPRVKRDLLSKKNGLVDTLKLKHNYASHLWVDEALIYCLTQSRTKVYSKQKREKNDAEYLEIYDKKTRSLVKEILLNTANSDSFDREILLHQGRVYIASKEGKVLFWEQNNLLNEAPKELLSPTKALNKLRGYGDFVFRFGKEGIVEIYKNTLHVKTIDIKQHRFLGYEALEDKRFDRVFDVLYADGKLFIANDLGEVHVYTFNIDSLETTYLTSLRDTRIKDAYDVLSLVVHHASILVVGTDRYGIYTYDLKTLQPIAQHLSKISIYHLYIDHDRLFFTQGSEVPLVTMYDMKQKAIMFQLEGEPKGVSDFKVHDEKVYWLDDGYVYSWDITHITSKEKH